MNASAANGSQPLPSGGSAREAYPLEGDDEDMETEASELAAKQHAKKAVSNRKNVGGIQG